MKKAAFLLIALVSPCAAQNADQATILKLRFRNCVYEAVNQQAARDRSLDINAMTEIGFDQCRTEEQGIYTLLYGVGINSVTASAIVTNLRLQIKAKLRDVANHPNNYTR